MQPICSGIAEESSMTDIKKLNETVNSARKALEQNQRVTRMAAEVADNSAIKMLNSVRLNTIANRLANDVQRLQPITGSIAGPLMELKRAGVLQSALQLQNELRSTHQMLEEFHKRFTLPEVSAVQDLVRQFQKSPLADVLKRYSESSIALQNSMEKMHRPWLDVQRTFRSVAGIAAIQGIGSILARIMRHGERM